MIATSQYAARDDKFLAMNIIVFNECHFKFLSETGAVGTPFDEPWVIAVVILAIVVLITIVIVITVLCLKKNKGKCLPFRENFPTRHHQANDEFEYQNTKCSNPNGYQNSAIDPGKP